MSRTAARLDPAPSFRFSIRFDDLATGGFSDCTGLQMETEVLEYAEGGNNGFTWRLPGRSKQSNVTLKRGIVDRVLWDWYQKNASGAFQARSCTIVVHDPSGSDDLLEFRLLNAFPIKWIGPELMAQQNNLAVETLELAHQGFSRRK